MLRQISFFHATSMVFERDVVVCQSSLHISKICMKTLEIPWILLFVNDLELCIKHSNLKLFADDSLDQI